MQAGRSGARDLKRFHVFNVLTYRFKGFFENAIPTVGQVACFGTNSNRVIHNKLTAIGIPTVLAFIGVSGAAAETTGIKIGLVTINDSQHESAKLFADESRKRTNGAVQGQIFPSGQLGDIGR
jgi:hypothetical protein